MKLSQIILFLFAEGISIGTVWVSMSLQDEQGIVLGLAVGFLWLLYPFFITFSNHKRRY